MRSLFAKILGSFVAALIATVLAIWVIAVLNFTPNASGRSPIGLLLNVGVSDARQAWEEGGAASLAATLSRFEQVTGATHVTFTDANGTDLLTGEAHPELVRGAHASWRVPFLRPPQGMVMYARFSSDGKYCLFAHISSVRLLSAMIQPAHLLVPAAIVLLCYALAYYLTAPLRDLRAAVERFGRGELDARAEENRRDELGELARAFNQMAERIQTLLGAQRRLLMDISHELRSPLARLSVAVELARSGQTGRLVDRIQREAERLNELISQMLQVSRWEGDKHTRRYEPVQLDQLVIEVMNDCSIEASARGCSLIFSPSANVSVSGDPELLRRAIENVMRNAIRHAPGESKIEISLQNGGGRASLKIRDYGPGVPEEALGQLFDPFYRVDPDRNRSSGGVGLGLSIARRAVELHEGAMHASNSHPGLMVEIELPISATNEHG